MGDTFNISNNSFMDHSSIIRNIYNGDNVDTISDELQSIKKELNQNGELYVAINELLNVLEKKNKKSITATIKQFSKEFSSPFFANVASASLLQFIDSLK